jgi:hypothetical protein
MDLNSEIYPIDFSEEEIDALKTSLITIKPIQKKIQSSKVQKDGFFYIKFTIKEIHELNQHLASILNKGISDEEAVITEIIDRLDSTLKNTAGYPIVD